MTLSGPFGKFLIPGDVFSDQMVEDFFWGTSDALEDYRVERPYAERAAKEPEPDDAGLPEL